MSNDDILILTASDVHKALQGKEAQVLEVVRAAYIAHESGASVVPPSCCLKFKEDRPERIIALPAHLCLEEGKITGVKWVASFPANLKCGADRASAVIVLNDSRTGRVEAIIEASQISLWRTAASAALAASILHCPIEVKRAGFIGCGKLSLELLRFLRLIFPEIRELWLSDLMPSHQEHFASRVKADLDGRIGMRFCQPQEVLSNCLLITLATTATDPHLAEPVMLPGSTLLHLSLRDLAPEIILAADNVVDDLEHAAREGTSIGLTQRRVGHSRFVRCTPGKILLGMERPREQPQIPSIFSPFGLGILDLAVAHLVLRGARMLALGLSLSGFHPTPWNRCETLDVRSPREGA